MNPTEELNNMIAGLDQLIEQLASRTPPLDVGSLINARGVIRELRRDYEQGCSRDHVREQVERVREIVDGKAAELGIRFPRVQDPPA